MSKSLLFIPDISGFTKFVQSTEIEHSQYVIAELLEVLISANTEALTLAEVEGDALFFYKEGDIPSQEKLLAQIETMFTAFYSHLKRLEKNRICPCNACASAPKLELKIISHVGEALQFLTVQGNRKPFGESVIEAHRLLKNTVNSDNYVLISNPLADVIGLSDTYTSMLFHFKQQSEVYDDKTITYLYADIDVDLLKIKSYQEPEAIEITAAADIVIEKEYPISANDLLELITNYKYRNYWLEGIDDFQYNEKEVTRIGSEHVCVIDGKHFDFVTITKAGAANELVYGEMTDGPAVVDKLYQFYVISPITAHTSKLKLEIYIESNSIFKKVLKALLVKRSLQKNIQKALYALERFALSNPILISE